MLASGRAPQGFGQDRRRRRVLIIEDMLTNLGGELAPENQSECSRKFFFGRGARGRNFAAKAFSAAHKGHPAVRRGLCRRVMTFGAPCVASGRRWLQSLITAWLFVNHSPDWHQRIVGAALLGASINYPIVAVLTRKLICAASVSRLMCLQPLLVVSSVRWIRGR